MKFEWDERKRRENIKKHGIDFVDIPSLFEGPMLERLDDRQDYGEDRWYAMGLLKDHIIVVIYVERRENIIRLISARKADYYEREKYEKFLRSI